jgi:hypothetical protein
MRIYAQLPLVIHLSHTSTHQPLAYPSYCAFMHNSSQPYDLCPNFYSHINKGFHISLPYVMQKSYCILLNHLSPYVHRQANTDTNEHHVTVTTCATVQHLASKRVTKERLLTALRLPVYLVKTTTLFDIVRTRSLPRD